MTITTSSAIQRMTFGTTDHHRSKPKRHKDSSIRKDPGRTSPLLKELHPSSQRSRSTTARLKEETVSEMSITSPIQVMTSPESGLGGAGLAEKAKFKLSSISRPDCNASIQACVLTPCRRIWNTDQSRSQSKSMTLPLLMSASAMALVRSTQKL